MKSDTGVWVLEIFMAAWLTVAGICWLAIGNPLGVGWLLFLIPGIIGLLVPIVFAILEEK